MSRKTAVVSIVCNLFCFLATAVCVARFFIASGDGNMQVTGWRGFIYFTVDSNVLAALSSLALAVFCLRRLRQRTIRLPRGLMILKLTGSSAVALTLVTVLAFLGPIYGYGMMFAGANLFLHLLCPLSCILSFALLERGTRLPFAATLLALLPTALYGVVYALCVLAWGVWEDFYRFNMGGMWYLFAPAILLVSWLLACALWGLNRLRGGKALRQTATP